MHQRKTRRTLLPQSTTPLRRVEREVERDDDVSEVDKSDKQIVMKLEYDSLLTGAATSPEKTQKIKRGEDVPDVIKRVRIAPEFEKNNNVFSQKFTQHQKNKFSYSNKTSWCWMDSVVILTSSTVVVHPAVAGFALEGCLVKEGSSDALQQPTFLFSEIEAKLSQLSRNLSKRIIIFANSEMSSLEKLKTNLIQLINTVGVPVEAFISIADDHKAMPSKGLWDTFLAQNESVSLDLQNSFFCGSSSKDKRFADNIGIPFTSPEQLFLGTRVLLTPPTIKDEKQELNQTEIPISPSLYTNSKVNTGPPEIIILVGQPGSGKTKFYRKYLQPYEYNHICKDRLGSDDRCVQMAAAALAKAQRVVIDCTNQTQRLRYPYTVIASRLGIAVRCFWFDTPPEMAQRFCRLRTIVSEGISKKISSETHIAYQSSFQPPSIEEGFNEMRTIRFSLLFETPKHQHVFNNNEP